MSERARLHVVGAGVAGLAAALAGMRAGAEVHLHEAAPQAGGRCRTVSPKGGDEGGFTHDNGTHALLGANPRALALLESIGARGGWIEPEPDGLPVYDAATRRLGRVGLHPLAWLKPDLRPDGLGFADLPRLARLVAPLPDTPIGALFAGRAIAESFVEPLTVAVLNTPIEIASARRLGRAMRRVLRPGGARLYVAERGLGPDLVAPALDALARGGARIATGSRLRALDGRDGRASGLVMADRTIPLGAGDAVILALPPAEIARLFSGIAVPDAYEPIVNAHFRVAGPARPRFVGLRHALSHWALARADHVSVTVSAAGSSVADDPEALSARIWDEVAPALREAGVAIGEPGEHRVVKEKRATIRQAAGFETPRPRLPFANLRLAGDWLTPLPATIEAAVISGEDAARDLLRGLRPPARASARAGRAAADMRGSAP
ncbi:hydroxysqualene dehydroxylase [Salinarimonas ramus]|uniref:Amine oxidase n=1 Tax=Salinarimonas ramus TaxID=690164 RepID=A0A917Q4N2_9HYPH|nr:FAD-dependent oxidoreductase [Salinarimonas ramus]GGK22648.1 amine oxidase [Salinarimonas ramus]